MIGYIKGKATVVSKEFCFIEAGGIGYRVFISEMSRQKIHLGTPVRLLTYMAVREDAILLYGFLTQEEYDLFLILISVSKIGPKVAMGILSVMEPADFVLSIRNRNLSVLTKLPGVGNRTAERMSRNRWRLESRMKAVLLPMRLSTFVRLAMKIRKFNRY